jgi:hypothetical protein
LDKYEFAVRSGDELFTQPYSKDELHFLTGDGCPEITAFRSALGVWDNFRVATGMNAETWTTKNREFLLRSAIALRDRMEREKELFSQDYSFRAPGTRSRCNTKRWIGFESGDLGFLIARHRGQLYFDVKQPEPKVIDFRALDEFDTVDGSFRIYRTPNELRWLQFLQRLAEFLSAAEGSEVDVRHGYAAKQEARTKRPHKFKASDA